MKFIVYDNTNINSAQELLDRIVNANIAAGEGPQWWYLNILIKYAKQVASIIEYGVFRGQSTAAFLVAEPKHILSCDIDLSKVDIPLFQKISSKTRTELEFMQKSSFDVNKEDSKSFADLIFLDTNHSFDYVQKELRCVKDFANKFIIVHDTNFPKPHRNPHRERLVRDAVVQFTAEAPFEIVEDIREVTGMMVLKRKYMKIRIKKEASTYMPMLIKAVQLTKGSVLELGAGIFSTPLLHWLCAEERRPLVTCESDPEYYRFAKKFISRTHRIVLIDSWNNIDAKTHWSVVLIDQNTNRGECAIQLKNSADFIILHDSEKEKLYGYDKVYPHFKYVYHWKFCKPYTTVVSNTNDLSKLKND